MINHRATYAAALLLALAMAAPAPAFITDPAYHHLDEIYTRIFALQDSFPEWVRVDSIGHSQAEKLPIYAVYISDDVNGDHVRPAVVINGQVHAEEVLGVEFCMWLLEKMVTNDARDWRRRVDTWIIPTANPEGLNVVYSLDYTYRKNKRDMIGDGAFRYKIGWGGDTSGVDLNRNFPTFWVHGDQFLVRGTNEFYDYYRGPGPASEAETRALIAFYDRIRPFYSNTLHSSRTGGVAQQVIYPWGYGKETKLAPDIAVLDELGNHIAQRCRKYGDATKPYKPVRILNARGDAEVFYYYAFGTNAVRVEIGDEGEAMQPDSAGIFQVINDTAPGLLYMLNSAAGNSEGGTIKTSRLDIKVIDNDTREPIGDAELWLDRWRTNTIPSRRTHPVTGMFYWKVSESLQDTLNVRKFGYAPWRRNVFGGTDPARITVRLTPLSRHQVVVNLSETGGGDLAQPVEMTVNNPDTCWTSTVMDGRAILDNLPAGEWTLTFFNDVAHVPRRVNVSVASDTAFNVALSPAVVLFKENFDGADVVHTSDYTMNLNSVDSLQRWDLTDDLYYSPPRCLTDSRWGNTRKGENSWDAPYNLLDRSFNLSNARTAALVFRLNQALEPDYDSMWVEICLNGAAGTDPSDWQWMQAAPAFQKLAVLNWEEMDAYINRPWNAPKINLMNWHPWQLVIIPLEAWSGNSNFHFRFRIKSDLWDQEDGVYIDDVMILASGSAPPAVTSAPLVPAQFSLGSAYPNPFNGWTKLRVNLPDAGRLQVSFYDAAGRLAHRAVASDFAAGSHTLTLNAGHLATGVYFLRAEFAGRALTRKVMLLK